MPEGRASLEGAHGRAGTPSGIRDRGPLDVRPLSMPETETGPGARHRLDAPGSRRQKPCSKASPPGIADPATSKPGTDKPRAAHGEGHADTAYPARYGRKYILSKGGWTLVTGGCGYVASPVVRALLARGIDVVVLDDLSTGHAESLPENAHLVVGDVRNATLLRELLDGAGTDEEFLGTFHFAGRTQVAESVRDPLAYYEANVRGSLSLLEALAASCPRKPVVFSSSAGVYGTPDRTPIPEDLPLRPMSPYGETKAIVEWLLADLHRSVGMPFMALRYFNAAGALPGATERHDPESHLIPNLLRAAATGRPVELYGRDYPTPDGTAVRDYVHIADLAEGHLLALHALQSGGASGCVNLGSGVGASLREVLEAAETVVGHPIAHAFGPPRPGDPPALVADITRARERLGFAPRFSDIRTVLSDAWAYGSFS